MVELSDKPTAIGREVLYERIDGGIAVIRLNRPDRRNAVNGEVTQALAWLVKQTEADPEVATVILTSSSEGFFCAGADLSAIAAGKKDELSTEDGGFAGFVHTQRRKPWIAAVDGPVLAGGFELCLACDMVVATRTARFGLPEVKRGLFAAAGGVSRAARVLPRNIALELVVTGDPLGAKRAFDLGLVNRLAEAGSLIVEAMELARAIAANAPLSVRESMAIARVADEITDAEARRLSDMATEVVFASEDAAEGPKAFLEKRAPVWSGC